METKNIKNDKPVAKTVRSNCAYDSIDTFPRFKDISDFDGISYELNPEQKLRNNWNQKEKTKRVKVQRKKV